MRVKVLGLALLAAIIALPFPASQLLAGPFSAHAPSAALATLIEDPFLADHLSFTPARSVADII